MSKALVAPDKFKGTFTAERVARAIASGLASVEIDLCPVADGGDGTAAILLDALGGEWVQASAHDPLGRRITARYAVLSDGSALIEVSAASGLARLASSERDALAASSAGTGELIADALRRGASTVLIACGGSATTDAGVGALGAFDPSDARIVCLCDVLDRFDGALRYAPQKGAGESDVAALRRRLATVARTLPRDPSDVPRAGAAGGFAGGMWAHGAELVSGAAYVLDAIGFDERLAAADTVITGEGKLDQTSKSGKAVGEIAARARRAGVPVDAIVGSRVADPRLGEELGLRSVREATTLSAITDAAAEISMTLSGHRLR